MLVNKTSFEARYRIDSSGCWIWTLKPNGRGRPLFYCVDSHRQEGASIASYWLYKGEVPEGLGVLHTCDIPMCVNPEHLYLGTQADNIRDMDARGRRVSPAGQDSHLARFTNQQADEIRLKYSSGKYSHRILANEYLVSRATIKRVIDGSTYKPSTDAEQFLARTEFEVYNPSLERVASVESAGQ